MKISSFKAAMLAASTAFVFVPTALAEPTWTGEGSLSAGSTSGNTETTDLGAGLNLTRDTAKWAQTAELSAQYNETDGENTTDRLFGALQLDRKLENDRWSLFGRGSYEADQFSGFDSRVFLGVGVGYKVLTGEQTTWSLEGGPGYKIDEVSNKLIDNVYVIGETEESVAVRLGSRFAHDLNELVALSNDTDVIWADISTQIVNSTAVTAGLSDALSLRVSFDVRHDTAPPIDTESTDTATRISLVYGIGG